MIAAIDNSNLKQNNEGNMKPFGLTHDNRIIIDLRAYGKRADDATNLDGMDDISEAPPSIEIITVGVWDTPWHGAFAITQQNLQEMIDHNDAGLRSGLPIDYEHDEDGGAAGWITNLRIEPSSANPNIAALWGDVKWTPKAAQAIKDGEYRYFSPEFYLEDYCDPMDASAVYDNVLMGGGLTNRPLMRNLIPVMAKDNTAGTNKADKKVLTANSQQNTIYVRKASTTDMNLDELKAKAKDELSAEELAFVTEHAADLSDDERTKFEIAAPANDEGAGDGEGDGGNDDGSGAGEGAGDGDGAGDEGAGTQASAKGKGKPAAKTGVYMSEAEARVLRQQAAEGARAMSILERKQMSEKVAGIVYNKSNGGKFPVTASEHLTDFMLGLSAAQRKQFDEIVELMPTASALFVETGSDAGATTGAVKAMQDLINEKMKANDKLTYPEALRIVARENPSLSKQYNAEIEGR